MDKQEGNKIIAIFDGWEFHPGNPNHHCDRHYYNLPDESCNCYMQHDWFTNTENRCPRTTFYYDVSFDALVPVVIKINTMFDSKMITMSTDIQYVWDQVVKMIEWINLQPK